MKSDKKSFSFKNRNSQASDNDKLELQSGISNGIKKLKIEQTGYGTHRKLTDNKIAEMGKLKQTGNS